MKNLPEDFVYLSDIDPTIIESVRYATIENFTGKIVDGYKNSRIVLTKIAAEAVKAAQKILQNEGFSMVVYDGYRPQKAVDAFILWGDESTEISTKELYYPTINKSDVFELGYLAKKRSTHSRGSTLDLSIIQTSKSLHSIQVFYKTLKNGEVIPILDDGTIDMGAGFDLFHEISHHDTYLIDEQIINHRSILRKAMKEVGFEEYSEEWWHYTLKNEPYPDTYFDFDIR